MKNEYYENILVYKSLGEETMRQPGFEPGSQPWQGRIIAARLLARKAWSIWLLYIVFVIFV